MKYREMQQYDIDQVFRVRISTRENSISMESLAALGITPQSVSRSLGETTKGWVCEDSGEVLGFDMGDGVSGEMLVLAILPEHEGRGIGRHLLELVQTWLFEKGHQELYLLENPDPSIRAYGFYRHLGWYPTGEFRNGEQVLRLCSGVSAQQGKGSR